MIKECLEAFYAALGQRVSYLKSQIMLLANAEQELAATIIEAIGMEQTQNMGKYLGIQTIQGRVTSIFFKPILDKMDAKLDGWKTKYLSVAGRHVIAQAVLATIPYYTMQVTYIPGGGGCETIDKKIRKFIWGSKERENWERVTYYKDQ